MKSAGCNLVKHIADKKLSYLPADETNVLVCVKRAIGTNFLNIAEKSSDSSSYNFSKICGGNDI